MAEEEKKEEKSEATIKDITKRLKKELPQNSQSW